MLRLIAAAAIVGAIPVGAQAPETQIIVKSASSRAEIQRILDADNLDVANLDARSVAEIMSRIERGRAPEEFWSAYQMHVRAWQKMAEAEERARQAMENLSERVDVAALLAEATEQVERTFTAVERIALDYGARIPIPPEELARTT